MKAKKAKAEKKSTKAKAREPKQPEAKDLSARALLENVKAIKLKKGRVEITDRQCVCETAGAVCVWDRDQKKRTLWIARKRVLEIARGE
jgi:hypothetical protein